MFILDDASPFGMSIPREYLQILKRGSKKISVLDAALLAEDLLILADEKPATFLGKGGVIVWALLKQKGFSQECSFVDIERTYEQRGERTEINYKLLSASNETNSIFVDDVIASGNTLNYTLRKLNTRGSDVWTLVLSGNIRGGYRENRGSTVMNTGDVYAARMVKRCDGNKPAILSARYLLRGVKENAGYRKYLTRYVGEDGIREVLGMLRSMDMKPFDMLYTNPLGFLAMYGGGSV